MMCTRNKSTRNLIQETNPSPPVILLKHVLGAVAMVHVPVEDEDAQGFVGNALRVAGGQGSRVEEAEPAGGVSLRVMPRGTYNSHAVPHLRMNTSHERQDWRNYTISHADVLL